MLHLKPEEKTLLITRRHWFVLVLYILPAFLAFTGIIAVLLFLPFMKLGFLPEWLAGILQTSEYSTKVALALFLAMLLLILWQIIFVQAAHYYLDAWVITDQRTVHTELLGLFSRFLTSIYHHQIQDVSVDVHGIFPTFLNYGNVQIQTAGTRREFVFREVPNPHKTKEVIVRAQLAFMKKMQETGIAPEKLQAEQKEEELVKDD